MGRLRSVLLEESYRICVCQPPIGSVPPYEVGVEACVFLFACLKSEIVDLNLFDTFIFAVLVQITLLLLMKKYN